VPTTKHEGAETSAETIPDLQRGKGTSPVRILDVQESQEILV